MVVGAHGEDHAGAREEPGGEEHEDEDDDDDPTEGRSGPSSRLTPERPTMALATRESGLHLWPHDSIGGVNERKLASRIGRDDSTRDPVTETARGRSRARPACSRSCAGGGSSGDDARAGGPAGDRSPDRRLHRVRPVVRLAPCRPPRPDLRAPAPPALRRAPGRCRRWRDGDDRRPVGPLVGAEPARSGDARGERRRDPRPAGALPRLHAREPAARSWSTTSTGWASCR